MFGRAFEGRTTLEHAPWRIHIGTSQEEHFRNSNKALTRGKLKCCASAPEARA
jgi:hypothetical protein